MSVPKKKTSCSARLTKKKSKGSVFKPGGTRKVQRIHLHSHKTLAKNIPTKYLFKGGHVPVHGARPLGSALRTFLNRRAVLLPQFRELALAMQMEPESCSIGEVIAANLLHQAIGNKAAYIKELLSRVDGKVPEATVADESRNVLRTAIADLPKEIRDAIEPKLRHVLGSLEQVSPVPANTSLENPAEPEDSRARSIRFYRSIADDLTQSAGIRLKAQERLDVLLGHVDPTGGGSSAEEFAEKIQGFLGKAELMTTSTSGAG